MGLFGNREEKRAKETAAQAQSERLASLPVADLAAEIMPAFGPEGMEIRSGHQRGAMQVTEWLFASTSGKVKYRQPVLGPAIEALQALENAGLLSRRNFGGTSTSASTYEATRAGTEALADGSVRQRLVAGA